MKNNENEIKLKRKEYDKWYKTQNKEKTREDTKRYHEKHKLDLKEYFKKHRVKYRLRLNSLEREKMKTDFNYKLKRLLRIRFITSLKKNKVRKNNSILNLLGCSIQDFRNHLESQFKPEMNWSNHGEVWEIDHIIPCSKFDLSKLEDQQKCFHYSNSQPLFKTTEIAENFGYREIGNRDKSNIC